MLKRKNKFLFLYFLFFIQIVSAQKTPIFLGQEEKEFGCEEIPPPCSGVTITYITWKYEGTYFITAIDGIARPKPYTIITKKVGNKVDTIPNLKLFGNNVDLITDKVNRLMLEEYLKDKKREPECFTYYKKITLDEVDITIDKNYMYFSYIWKENHFDQLEGLTNCTLVFSTSVASVPIKEIKPYLILTK